jgi:beta-lactamase regulating signal transducer with metallopeptidase domain
MHALLEVGLSNAVAATLLAVVAAAGSRICRRPAVVHGLWLLVLVKLLTPPLVRIPVPWQAGAPAPPALTQADTLPSAQPMAFDRAALIAQLQSLEQSPPYADKEPTPPAALAVETVALCWLAGSVMWFGWTAAYLMRFRRLLRHAAPVPAELQRKVEELARRLGLRRVPSLALVPGQLSPMVWSLFGRPQLLFPARLLEGLSPLQRDTLVLHELAHLARRDHWVRWLELLASGCYWWLPVLWLARRGLHAAEEECCDAHVTRGLPDSGRDYALALVHTLAFLSPARAALPATASGVGAVPQIKRRLTMILRDRPSPTLSRLGGAALLALALLWLPWAPTLAQQPKEPQASPGQIRQQQIETLRQLLKTLEEQQRAEEKAAKSVHVRIEAARALSHLGQKVALTLDQFPADPKKKKDEIKLGGVAEALVQALGDQQKKAADAKAKLDAEAVLQLLEKYEALLRHRARLEIGGLDTKEDEASIQQLKVLIEKAKADMRVAEAKLRELQDRRERMHKAGLSAKGTTAEATVLYLQERLDMLNKQLKGKDLKDDEANRLRDERIRVQGLLKLLKEAPLPKTPPPNKYAPPQPGAGPAPGGLGRHLKPSAEAPSGDDDFQVIRLRSAKADAAAKLLDELFNGRPQEKGTNPRLVRIRVVADAASNTLLIRASPLDLRSIRDLLDKLEADKTAN